MDKKKARRRTNIIYKLRKKGVRVDTRRHTIECAAGEDSSAIVQVQRLRREYNFYIQITII